MVLCVAGRLTGGQNVSDAAGKTIAKKTWKAESGKEGKKEESGKLKVESGKWKVGSGATTSMK